MAATIPEAYKPLIEGPVVVVLASVTPEGEAHASPVWCSTEGEYILVNTTKGRQKAKNFEANPDVSIVALDPENPYRYVEVRGKVEEMIEEGGLDHINQLAQLYVNEPKYYGGVAPAEMEGQETRIICKIRPSKVVTFGE